jgi:Skp family chaperone for outer membrane proteins
VSSDRTEGSSRSGVQKEAVASIAEKTDATARSADVKKSHRWAILATVLSVGCLISLAVAQQTTPPARPQTTGGPRLALIDISRIFKAHTRFKQQMEEMKRDVQAAENKVRQERDEISKLVTDVLPTFQKGTQQYSEMEEQLADRQAKLAVTVNRQKNEFLQREATIYHNVYQEIWQATDYFCRQNSIDMVLRFNGEPVDVQRPDSVLTFINKPVVWYDPGLDITEAILRDVNRPGANSATATDPRSQPPASPFRR